MDQWRSKFSESFSLDRYWSIECSSCTKPFKYPQIHFRTENTDQKGKNACKYQDTFDHDKGQKSAISGRRLHWRLSTGFFAFSPGSLCNLVRRAPQNLEKVAKNPVEKIASNPVTSVAVMVFSALKIGWVILFSRF